MPKEEEEEEGNFEHFAFTVPVLFLAKVPALSDNRSGTTR